MVSNDYQAVRDDRGVDLDADYVFGVSPERLDLQMLLYPFEKQLHGLSALVCGESDELVTAIKLYEVPVSIVTVDSLPEFVFADERHNLSEDGFSFVHGLRMTFDASRKAILF